MIKANQNTIGSAVPCKAKIGVNGMQILLCDDDAVFLETLRRKIRHILVAGHIEAAIFTARTPEDISEDLISSSDVFFLDIDFSGKAYNGIDIAKRVRERRPEAIIVFVTNYVEYAPEGYEVQAFRYAMKCDLPEKLERYLLEIIAKLTAEQEPVEINIAGETITLPLADILYIESQNHIAIIHTRKNGTQSPKDYRLYASLSSLEEKLASRGFLRIHKSYLVNMRHLKKYQCTEAVLDGGIALRVSEKSYAEQKRKYMRWKGKQ